VQLNEEAVIFWQENFCKCNGIPIWPVKKRPTRIVYSDASSRTGLSKKAVKVPLLESLRQSLCR